MVKAAKVSSGSSGNSGSTGRDAAVVTLEEALAEVEARPTLFWGASLRSLARRAAPLSAVRFASSEWGPEIPGLTQEITLSPSSGEETRLVSSMPRSRHELVWRLQVAASILPVGAEVWIAGHSREGIKSAKSPLEAHIGPVITRRTKRHSRVLSATLQSRGPAPSLEDQEERFLWTGPEGLNLELATLPGTFAHGRVDHGARAMLEVLSSLECTGSVLDLGAGAGVLGGALAKRFSDIRVDLVDHSASACASMKRMVTLNGLSEARVAVHLAPIKSAPKGPYDLVVTNPPFHEGRHQNRSLVDDFVQSACARLRPGGLFLLVANRHLGYADSLRTRFRKVDVAREDTRFRVWRAEGVRR